MRPTTILAVITCVLGCAIAQAGDVYKYTDKSGNTLYTDKPMPGAILVSTGSQRPPDAARQAYASQQASTNRTLAESNQRIADQQQNSRLAATVAKDLEATRVERCKTARDAYNRSINARRLYKENPDGTRTYLTDAELAQQRMDAARQVESICGPQG